eukprot:5778010-Pleurochrysis_carterae.AAC.3
MLTKERFDALDKVFVNRSDVLRSNCSAFSENLKRLLRRMEVIIREREKRREMNKKHWNVKSTSGLGKLHLAPIMHER